MTASTSATCTMTASTGATCTILVPPRFTENISINGIPDGSIGYAVIMVAIDHTDTATDTNVRLVEGWFQGARFDRSSFKAALGI